MPAGGRHARKLIVEGMTDKRVMPYLMEANGVVWPQPPHHPVEIESWGSIDEILKPEAINNEVKEPGREALGVVVDANGDAAARWDELKVRCDSEFAGLPDRIPDKGLHLAHSLGTRFGVWIMPDNRFEGMLEDMLVRLVPDDSGDLYRLARNCVATARSNDAPFKDVHERKAEILHVAGVARPAGAATARGREAPRSRPDATRVPALRRLVQASL